MSVKPLSKTINKPVIPNEKHIERFIGNANHPQDVKVNENDHKLTLRLPKALIGKIDKLRAQRPGIISRNQCILELLQKAFQG